MKEDSGHSCLVPININDVLCNPYSNHKIKTCGRLKKKTDKRENKNYHHRKSANRKGR